MELSKSVKHSKICLFEPEKENINVNKQPLLHKKHYKEPSYDTSERNPMLSPEAPGLQKEIESLRKSLHRASQLQQSQYQLNGLLASMAESNTLVFQSQQFSKLSDEMTCLNVDQFKTNENREVDDQSSFSKMIKDHDVKYDGRDRISEESSDQLSISVHFEKR